MNDKYDAIICDLGRVLIDFDHRIAVKKILPYTKKKEEEIYSLFFDSPITQLYEEGRMSSEEFYIKVKDELSLTIDYKGFFRIWEDIFYETPLNKKMQEFLKSIKRQYKLVMVSNINKRHFEFLRKKMPIFNAFDKIILSYEVGTRKPAPEIYYAALNSVKTTPDKVFYIDDREDLVEAAGKMGIKGLVFNGEDAFENLKKEITCAELFNNRWI